MIKGAKAYFQTQINTTEQGDLLVLLYEGGIKYLRQAKIKIAEKDYAEKGLLISKAIDVISELDESLNPEKGGEVAQNLHQLYFYCNTRLLRANLEMNVDLIDEVLRVLEGLCDAFRKINSMPEAQNAMAAGQAGEPPKAETPTQAAPVQPKAPAAPASAAPGQDIPVVPKKPVMPTTYGPPRVVK